ncbi:MAG TPA: 5-formyltetrahydrofolate cyclo-ligase [Steroidobacteraceae bacterium]|jgi:5-formyltetrahydrofolate cyclo-ligase|nr:5-formyltetrahydrofolate cyclo-ligase [Steroidobacteraceae bacterium]
MAHGDEPHDYSSPVCYAADIAAVASTWSEIRAWRKATRAELIARRMARDPAERKRLSEPVIDQLHSLINARRYPVLGLYWPIRAEIDLREFARQHVAAGGIVGLPVVVEDAAPLEFWRWRPAVALKRGRWNIPVPPERDLVHPDVLVVPLVGFDAQRYRLGYGGGFYDRTLAAAKPRPRTIGIAFRDAQLPSIFPQPHDVPMDTIVTEHSPSGLG